MHVTFVIKFFFCSFMAKRPSSCWLSVNFVQRKRQRFVRHRGGQHTKVLMLCNVTFASSTSCIENDTFFFFAAITILCICGYCYHLPCYILSGFEGLAEMCSLARNDILNKLFIRVVCKAKDNRSNSQRPQLKGKNTL